MAALTDGDLMAQACSGDREAFGALVDRHKDSLVNYLTRLTRDRDRAEDLAQEAFVRLFLAAKRYREEGKLTALLFRIATNLLRTEERRAKRWRLLQAALPVNGRPVQSSPQTDVLREEAQRQVASALARLPLAYRAPLVLRDIEGWSYEQIAAAAGRPAGTVKSRISRARQRLRDDLAHYWSGDQP